MPRRDINVRYPNSPDEDLQCLSIDRVRHDVQIFVPLRCNQRRPFICQRDGHTSNGRDIKMMGSTRIDEEVFVLYSTRCTWPEAVVQCRKEDLQIAEVKTTAQAQSLALLMIRARPESIENAWIGGYATGNAWKWLPSGSNISNNDLWKYDNRGSHGCLLLDRHICELPVYLEAKCDRKRDVICQRPFKKQMSEKLIPVYAEGCPYWIGLRALTWFQAQLSCQELNASLVILDSPRIISHMMSLMENNREELRHIWTDGRRKSSRLISNNTMLQRWIWESIGVPVPEIGASFIPWCSADRCHDNDANCLNLDRADYDTPIVYGLLCNQSQTYVCQPRSGACVSSRSSLGSSYASSSEDDLPQLQRTATAFYHDEEVNQKSRVTRPLSINTIHGFPSKTRNQFNDLQKNVDSKQGISSNFSECNDYDAKENYTDKVTYAKVNEGDRDGDIKNTTVFSVPSHYGSKEPIEVRITSKNTGNIHGQFKLDSSLSNHTASLINNGELLNGLTFRFKYLPIKVFDGRTKLYDKVKIYPRIFYPLTYSPINRDYYYPWYRVRTDRRKVLSNRDQDTGSRNGNNRVTIAKKFG